MKITITITMSENGRSCDIQVSDTQKIAETLLVLQENINSFKHADMIHTVREKRTGRHISTECTYEEAGIYSGTELLLPASNGLV
ncbi:MAG: hypothetical protein NC434_15270 [Ruminococcus sp.]|nr:hypothetical protein [Ruminococcus sp.]